MKTNVLTVAAAKKSTNVRLIRVDDLRMGSLQVLSRVAPRITARWVAKKFLTPPPARRVSAKTRAFWASAEDRFTVTLETNLGGLRERSGIPVWLWGRGPPIYMLHGWGGRGTQWAQFIEPLVDAGFTAVVLDAPGHGDSQAPRTSILHFAASLDAVVESVGPARCLMGHSLGGAAAALALRQGLATGGAVLVGAPADPAKFFDVFLRRMGIPDRLHAYIKIDVERRYGFAWEQFAVSAPRRKEGQSDVPALIVHDAADDEVNRADADVIAAAWPGARVMTTRGLGHQRILRDPDVVKRVVAWLSSGAREASAPGSVLG
jgi:pimeloyl-ACP methyl ester carboxylesterase